MKEVVMRKVFTVFALVLVSAVQAGVGKMASRPVWDLADHGGARSISRAAALEVPNASLPNVTAFTIEMKLKFNDMQPDCGFTVCDQSVTQTGWGLWFTTIRGHGCPLMLRLNGENYVCSHAFVKAQAGETHTFVVTARKGWIVVYKDGRVQKSFMMSATPNLAPLKVGGPHVTGVPKKELSGVVLESLRIWDDAEEFWGVGEEKKPLLGYKAGRGWLVNAPVEPVKGVPNVFYYGDSISVGYSTPFRRLLKEKANLYHWMSFLSSPGAKGVGVTRFEEVCRLADYDYVVFNNGLHSLSWTPDKVSDEEIRSSYATLAQTLKRCAPHAKIFYLTTTPHTAKKNAEGKVVGLGEKNDIVQRLNRIALAVMKAEGIPVIDGYALCEKELDWAAGDQFHWKAPAYQLLAESIVKAFGL